jgi:hypothetical protein
MAMVLMLLIMEQENQLQLCKFHRQKVAVLFLLPLQNIIGDHPLAGTLIYIHG